MAQNRKPAPVDGIPQKSTDFVSPEGASSADLVARMLKVNPELQAMRLREAEARLVQAGMRPNPRAEFQEKGFHLAGEAIDREEELTVTQPLELGGRRSHRMSVAQTEVERLRYDVEALELARSADLLSLIGVAITEASRLRVIEPIGELNERLRGAAVLRVNAGDGSRYEAAQIDVEVARIGSQKLGIVSPLNGLLFRIKALCVIEMGEVLRLREAEAEPGMEPMTLDEALKLALDGRPDLKAARLAVQEAEAKVGLAESAGVPDVGAIVGLKRVAPPGAAAPPADWIFKVGVSVTLPLFHRNQGQIREQALALEEARLHVAEVEQIVRRDVTAVVRLELARRNAVLHEKSLTRLAENISQMAKLGFDLGELRLSDYIQEQRQLADVETSHVQAKAEVFQAEVELERAVGKRLNR